MHSFEFDIGDRARKVSRFIFHVRHELQRALLAEKSARKVTQQSIAEKIGVNRSVINRQLMGEENLTLRSVADLAWALGWDLSFKLEKPEIQVGRNDWPRNTTSVLSTSINNFENAEAPKSAKTYANVQSTKFKLEASAP
jgi:DNA-binding phage protein